MVPAVCRVIQRLRPLLALGPTSRPVDTADRLWIVDGTLVPVRDRQVGASSRTYRFSVNVQVIIDADTRLLVATARHRATRPMPVCGATLACRTSVRVSQCSATAPVSTPA